MIKLLFIVCIVAIVIAFLIAVAVWVVGGITVSKKVRGKKDERKRPAK